MCELFPKRNQGLGLRIEAEIKFRNYNSLFLAFVRD
jgi:hypothetical protein